VLFVSVLALALAGPRAQAQFETRNLPIPTVRIESAVPDPVGLDKENELVVLRNLTDKPLDLRGWYIVNRNTSFTWSLASSGPIPARGIVRVLRHGRKLSLRNHGDTIDVKDPWGRTHDTLTWDSVRQGEEVTHRASPAVKPQVGAGKKP
jgi:hypothetical protein